MRSQRNGPKALQRRLIGGSLLFAAVLCLAPSSLPSQAPGNKSERLEWFRDQGLGLFVHWSVDSQLGVIISHSLPGASEAYTERFFRELPETFNPTRFDPDALARLARVAGFRYMVFTAKHHNGFCMWNTATEPFNIMNTPYSQDITAKLFTAFRAQGVAPGVYFSPDDFRWLYEHGKPIQRLVPDVQPRANPGLMQLDQAQTTELMTKYGPVSVVFFDGEAAGLREIVWHLQPDSVVTRGAMETPEQNIPGAPLPGAWEANMTIGTAWGYQPSDEQYKPAGELIRLLIQTRARGGNLLLNVGLAPDGTLPLEQEERLRTLGSWMFINSAAIYGTRPWVVTNEDKVWFTRAKDHHVLYAIVDDPEDAQPWKRGMEREFVLKTVRAKPSTTVSVLGQNDQLVEYRPELKPLSHWQQLPDGLHLRVTRAQRLRDSDRWPYPTVIQLSDVEENFTPPSVTTLPASARGSEWVLHGQWAAEAAAPGTRISFDYRVITGEDTQSRLHGWQHLPSQAADHTGEYTAVFHPAENQAGGEQYEFRAVLQHPLLTIYGQPLLLPTRPAGR